jgi:hypothetical protein
MKQNITLSQFHELSDKAKKKLWDFSLPKKYLFSSDDKQTIYPLLSIGQMIEFLYAHQSTDWSIHFGRDLAFYASSGRDTLYGKTSTKRDGELCDGLWEAVKEVLQ